MESKQWEFFQQYLLFPAVVALVTAVATSIATYVASYQLRKWSVEEARKANRKNLIDKILIELNRLIPLFEKLRSDFDKDNLYSFRNIELISNARWRLAGLLPDVTLLNDDTRLMVLEATDTISTLVDELNALENNPVQGYTELKNTLRDAIKDDRAFRIEILKMGIQFFTDKEGNITPRYIDEKNSKSKTVKNDEKLKEVEEMRQGILSSVTGAQRQLDQTNADANRRRDRLVAKIIDAQRQLKELQTELLSLKSKS